VNITPDYISFHEMTSILSNVTLLLGLIQSSKFGYLRKILVEHKIAIT
jgi:hypothetical protein